MDSTEENNRNGRTTMNSDTTAILSDRTDEVDGMGVRCRLVLRTLRIETIDLDGLGG